MQGKQFYKSLFRKWLAYSKTYLSHTIQIYSKQCLFPKPLKDKYTASYSFLFFFFKGKKGSPLENLTFSTQILKKHPDTKPDLQDSIPQIDA